MHDTQVLTRYKAWADDLFLSVVSSVPAAELTAPRPILFGSLIRTLNHDEWYVGYAGSVTERELAETVEFEFIGGGSGRLSRNDILLHVVNHTTYHRGQAAGILYYLGVLPPTTDLPVFRRQQSVGA